MDERVTSSGVFTRSPALVDTTGSKLGLGQWVKQLQFAGQGTSACGTSADNARRVMCVSVPGSNRYQESSVTQTKIHESGK